jgi:antitoxin (DNA-binding transcriptional repressor) of toxin-antitoxin stability system
MIHKLKTKSGTEIPIRDDEALARLLAEANAGNRLVITAHGIVDVSSIDSIVPHHELNSAVADKLRLQRMLEDGSQERQFTPEQARDEVLGAPQLEGVRRKLLGETGS